MVKQYAGIESIIRKKLVSALEPSYLEVSNESHMHCVPENSETHFKVILVSALFERRLPLKRHQQVYQILSEEMYRIHALELHTYTPIEWKAKGTVPVSPVCMGGKAPKIT